MWQVPRGMCELCLSVHWTDQVCLGNFYSIHNTYDRPARVLFAQGCYMAGDEEGVADE